MDFLNKIKQYITRDGNKEFRKQVLEEKKQKYLFSDDLTDKYHSSRAGFFSRKKRAIAPYTSFFGDNFYRAKKKIINSHFLGYIGVMLIFLSCYIIFFSPYFRISPSRVIIEARNDGIDIGVAYRVIEDIYGTSLFFLDEEAIAHSLKRSLKNLAHVTIDTLYPNGVKILMTSTPIIYNTKIFGSDREWQMSNNGVLVQKNKQTGIGTGTSITSLKELEVISEALRAEVFFEYKQIISDEKMLLLNKIIELFESEWKDLHIIKTRYFSRENEVHLTLKGGTQILITLESEGNSDNYTSRIESLKNQLLGLKTYIDKHNGQLLDGSIIYIDARIVKKIFVCKEAEVCKNNLIRIYGETYR